MNFVVKEYDPIEEAIQKLSQFNQDPTTSDHTEDELIQLAVHKIKQHTE